MGSLLNKVQGTADPSMPGFVGLAPKMGHVPWSDNGVAGFLGASCAPFEINKGGGKDDMILNGVTLDRLADRRALLSSLDQFRRDVDSSGTLSGSSPPASSSRPSTTSARIRG
jgi:hypothetical protein